MRRLLVFLILLIALPVYAQLVFDVEGIHEENGKLYMVLPGEAEAIEMQQLFFGSETAAGFARDGKYYLEIPAEALEAMAAEHENSPGLASSVPGYYYDGDFPEGGGFICHHESEGYLVAIPAGWVHNRC